ncbi:MAG: hypothetical protein ABEH43_10980, partial [Flavobacteriales bacterium]
MTPSSLYIKTFSIYKMPGFQQGLKPYEGLTKGINIIAGPNASGKSSTAKLIQHLFRQKGSRGYHAEATLDIAGEEWWIKLDEGQIQIQREGQEDQLRALPSKESLDHYMLAFHQLVNEE